MGGNEYISWEEFGMLEKVNVDVDVEQKEKEEEETNNEEFDEGVPASA